MLGSPGVGLGDTAPVPPAASWGAGADTSRIDELASRIATSIAGHRVSVRCGGELPSELCWPLQQFAQSTAKPTKCGRARIPCYSGIRTAELNQTPAFWAAYDLTATAILTLAQRSIHPQPDANAYCLGMQWMPYVAERLGDTPDDAQAIARYAWEEVYPALRKAHPGYWSAQCRPGGALDGRAPGTTAWP